MSGIVPAHPVLSRMTLALLEDSGYASISHRKGCGFMRFYYRWYTVNYSMAQPLVWGRGSGCGLPTGSCGGYIQSQLDQ